MKNREWRLLYTKGKTGIFFQEAGSPCSISKIQGILTSLESPTKSLEYNPEQCFLFLGGSQ